MLRGKKFFEAVLREVEVSEKVPRSLASLFGVNALGISAERAGLGSRGRGDFAVHKAIREIISSSGERGSKEGEDSGVFKIGKEEVVIAVDGMHSRLSHFPFLAGFHATRAALRDVAVTGGEPRGIFLDVHIGTDGDVAKVLEYVAGAEAVAEYFSLPILTGSTLRIGGDLVRGDRIVGFSGALGRKVREMPKEALPGDVLLMTEGHGGGTIATTALYNSEKYFKVALRTFCMKDIEAALYALNFKGRINGATDVTNGGIVGDLTEMSKGRAEIWSEEFLSMIDREVLEMLRELDLDPYKISIDAILFSMPLEDAEELRKELKRRGISSEIVGEVKEGKGIYVDGRKVSPGFRETPYTPDKREIERISASEEELSEILRYAKKLRRKVADVVGHLKGERSLEELEKEV